MRPTNQERTELITLIMRAASTAVQKPEILIPSTTRLVSLIIVPLTTKVNSPKVRRLIGNVKSSITGLIIALKMDNTIPAIRKLPIVSK